MQVPPFLGYRMQCYGGTDSPILSIKELQKLLEFTSRNSLRPMYLIYNSRNYQSLLAIMNMAEDHILSTIVEIIRAYQPSLPLGDRILYLQQQKLLELTSPCFVKLARFLSTIVEIIRAYQPSSKKTAANGSTIVEIIRAYQPAAFAGVFQHNLQQQKLLELTSHKQKAINCISIYNSRNYQSLLAVRHHLQPIRYLQQQKLLELTSRPSSMAKWY